MLRGRHSPPTPWSPSVAAPVPLAYDLPSRRALLLGRTRLRPLTRARRRVITGSPWLREIRKGEAGPPRFLGRPSRTCRGRPPRRTRRSLAHPGSDADAFRRREALGVRILVTFRGCSPTAHTLARLRIAGVVAAAVARLAADLPGSALVGRDSHPQDDFSEFPVGIATSFPFGPAFPGHTTTRDRPDRQVQRRDRRPGLIVGSLGNCAPCHTATTQIFFASRR